MAISRRVWVPASLAFVCVAVIGAYLFFQLDSTRTFLQNLSTQSGSNGSVTGNLTLSPLPVNDAGDEALLHLRKGDVMALRGDWADAEKEYKEGVNKGGGLTALRKLAQAQLQRRDTKGAQDTLDQLRRNGAKEEDLVLLESLIHIRSGDLMKAKGVLTVAEDSPQKHYGLALVSIAENNLEGAKTELQTVLAGWEPVLRAYAKTLLGAYEEYALFPESPQIHLLALLSRALADVQECELALPMLQTVVNAQDDYRDAWIVRGYCELTTERSQDALVSLERAYQIDPQKPEVQYFLGRAYAMQGDHGNALTFLQYALENGFTPKKEVRRVIAIEALAMGNLTLAMEQYEADVADADADFDAYLTYVTNAITGGRKQEAYLKAKEATEKYPADARAFDLLGTAAIANDAKDDARAALQKALELDPDLHSASQKLNQLGN